MGKYRFVGRISYSPTKQVFKITVPREVSLAILDELKRKGIRTKSLVVEVMIND